MVCETKLGSFWQILGSLSRGVSLGLGLFSGKRKGRNCRCYLVLLLSNTLISVDIWSLSAGISATFSSSSWVSLQLNFIFPFTSLLLSSLKLQLTLRHQLWSRWGKLVEALNLPPSRVYTRISTICSLWGTLILRCLSSYSVGLVLKSTCAMSWLLAFPQKHMDEMAQSNYILRFQIELLSQSDTLLLSWKLNYSFFTEYQKCRALTGLLLILLIGDGFFLNAWGSSSMGTCRLEDLDGEACYLGGQVGGSTSDYQGSDYYSMQEGQESGTLQLTFSRSYWTTTARLRMVRLVMMLRRGQPTAKKCSFSTSAQLTSREPSARGRGCRAPSELPSSRVSSRIILSWASTAAENWAIWLRGMVLMMRPLLSLISMSALCQQSTRYSEVEVLRLDGGGFVYEDLEGLQGAHRGKVLLCPKQLKQYITRWFNYIQLVNLPSSVRSCHLLGKYVLFSKIEIDTSFLQQFIILLVLVWYQSRIQAINNIENMSLFGAELNAQIQRLLFDIRLKLAQNKFAPNLRTLYRSFARYDPQISGTIRPDHFEKALNENGLFFKKYQVQVFEKAYKHEPNRINWFQFLEHLREPMDPVRRQLVQNIFDAIDAGRQGRVTPSQLMKYFNPGVIESYKRNLKSRQQIEAQFLSMLSISEGFISREQFISFYDDCNINFHHDDAFTRYVGNQWDYKPSQMEAAQYQQVKAASRALRAALIKITQATRDDYLLRKMFGTFDLDYNACLGQHELDLLLRKFNVQAGPHIVGALLDKMDVNRTGFVEFEDWKAYLLNDPYPL